MNIKDAVAKRIESLCRENVITYNGLANMSGLTPSTIYSIFDKSRQHISLNTVKIICDDLNITLKEFFDDPIFDSLEQEIQ